MYKKLVLSTFTILSLNLGLNSFATPYVNHFEKTFYSFDHTRLFEQSWVPFGKPKAVVIIMHGLKDRSELYSDFAKKLADNNYAVYAFDLRGHGKSGGERVYIDSFEEYINDFDLFFKNVQQREKGSPIFLMGHSMGGAIVARYIIEREPDIKGFILSAPAIKEGKDISPDLISATKKVASIFPRLKVLELKDNLFSRDPDTVKKNQNDPLISHENGPAKTAAELLDTLVFIQNNLEKINKPFLDLHGTADQITNPEGSKMLYEKASSTDKTLKNYDGLYHDLLHEPEKDKVSNDILEWFNKHN